MKISTKQSSFLLLFFLATAVYAQDSEQNLFMSQLNELDSKLQELAASSNSFESYVNHLPPLLEFLNTEAKTEYFLSHEANKVFQKRVSEKARNSFKDADNTLKGGVDRLTEAFPRIYPKASSFILTLYTIVRKDEHIRNCLAKKEYPQCIWNISLQKETSAEDVSRFAALLKFGYLDPQNDSLTKLVLYYLEGTILNNNREQPSCEKQAPDFDFSDVLSKGDEAIAHSLSVTNRIVVNNSACKDYILKNINLLSVKVCSSGFAKSCLITFDLLKKFGTSEKELADLKKNLIVSVKDGESLRIAKNLIDKTTFLDMSFSQRLKVFSSGMLPVSIYVVVISLLGIPLFLVSLYFALPKLATVFSFIPFSFKKKSSIDFSSAANAQRLDEYSTLLQVFNLSEEATGSDIKKAYRTKMKQLHPDASNDGTQEEIDRVQEAYDRLMHLRRTWFGTDR